MAGDRRCAVVLFALAIGLASCDLARSGLEEAPPAPEPPRDGSSSGTVDAGGAPTDAPPLVATDAAAPPAPALGGDAAPSFCDRSDPTLLLCLRFEDVVRDESANALLPASANVLFVPGVRGEAARFLPPSSVIVYPSAAIWNVARFTVETWVRPESLPTGSARAGLLDSDGRFGLFVYAPGTIDCLAQSVHLVGPTLTAARWTHVACVYDGTAVTLYVGGTATATAPLPSAGATGGSTAIGENSPSGDPFTGDLDELRVFSAARTPAEIAAAATP